MAMFNFKDGMTWKDYLRDNSFFPDSTGALGKTVVPVDYAVSESIKQYVTNDAALSGTFIEIIGINGTLPVGFGVTGRKINSVHHGMELLGAVFEWGMSFLWFCSTQNSQTLNDILKKLYKLYGTANSHRLSEAMDLYYMGRIRLEKGLLDKALESFCQAEKLNDTDILTQHSLGYLYLYGLDDACDLIDPAKAHKHFMNSARYLSTEMPRIPHGSAICSEAYYQASVASYVQAAEEKAIGNDKNAGQLIYESARLAINACKISPKLAENFYQLARISAILGKTELSFKSLIKAIQIDRNYCIKADIDNDFYYLRPELARLYKSLRNRERQRAKKILQKLQVLPDHTTWVKSIDKGKKGLIKAELLQAKDCYDNGTLFDCLDCIDQCAHVIGIYKTLKEQRTWKKYQKHSKKKKLGSLLNHWSTKAVKAIMIMYIVIVFGTVLIFMGISFKKSSLTVDDSNFYTFKELKLH